MTAAPRASVGGPADGSSPGRRPRWAADPDPTPQPAGRARGRHKRPRGVRLPQRLGQSLALPVAALPAAGLLLRAGQPDLLGRWRPLSTLATVCSAAGSGILDNLPLLFALGIGLGLPRGRDRTGPVLACAVAYLVLAHTLLALCPIPAGQPDNVPTRWPYGALGGLIAGLLAVYVWQWVERRRIPAFAGYALVAVIAAGSGWVLSLAYPAVNRGLTAGASATAHHAVIGGGMFGFLNRILIPVGLHQVPNTVVWWLTGKCRGGVTGDIPCFLHGDPHSGIYLSGFFPIAMFALPAAALAMWQCAPPDQRRAAAQILLPAAVLSFAFGITEPMEFAFCYIAFRLYFIHAVLTGTSLALVNWLGIRDGFIFSAGCADYLFNWDLATKPLWLLPIGAAYAVVYFLLFRFAIVRYNLPTPGRARAGPPLPHPDPNSPTRGPR